MNTRYYVQTDTGRVPVDRDVAEHYLKRGSVVTAETVAGSESNETNTDQS